MKGARLEVWDQQGQERLIPLKDDRFTIGRSHSNSLALSSAEISRQHAEIVRSDNRYILRDLGSRAGTSVNDRTVTEQTLAHGDQIRIGRHHELSFLIEDEATTTKAAPRRSGTCDKRRPSSKGSAPWGQPRCWTRFSRWCSTTPSR